MALYCYVVPVYYYSILNYISVYCCLICSFIWLTVNTIISETVMCLTCNFTQYMHFQFICEVNILYIYVACRLNMLLHVIQTYICFHVFFMRSQLYACILVVHVLISCTLLSCIQLHEFMALCFCVNGICFQICLIDIY